jgi:hypothetical protein
MIAPTLLLLGAALAAPAYNLPSASSLGPRCPRRAAPCGRIWAPGA